MGTRKFLTLLAAGSAACAAPLWAIAQPATDVPPPQLEVLEEGAPPAVTIRSRQAPQEITETREKGGKVNQVKVTSGTSTYYLKPNEPAGSALPGDTQSKASRGAQWRLMEFDWGQQQDARTAGAQAVDAPPPALPPAPAGK
jgi:hypothetical protein